MSLLVYGDTVHCPVNVIVCVRGGDTVHCLVNDIVGVWGHCSLSSECHCWCMGTLFTV